MVKPSPRAPARFADFGCQHFLLNCAVDRREHGRQVAAEDLEGEAAVGQPDAVRGQRVTHEGLQVAPQLAIFKSLALQGGILAKTPDCN